VQNIGPNISFISADQSDPIYRNAKVGFAVKAYDKNLIRATLIGDINQLLVRGEVQQTDGTIKRPYQKPIFNGGAEVAYEGEVALALRAGRVNDADGSIKDWTFGLGIGYHKLDFDFASIPQANDPNGQKLARVSKFSLGASF